MRMLTHCIENVFERLPPEEDIIPTTEACVDAAAYVQAFLFKSSERSTILLGPGSRNGASRIAMAAR